MTPEDMIRKYSFDYSEVIYNGKNLTVDDIKADLKIYFDKILT